jgi:signal transduction histidine kinase
MRGPRLLACALAALAAVLGVTVAVLAVLSRDHVSGAASLWLVPPAVAVPSAIGARIVWAQPRNRIGWILTVGPIGSALTLGSFVYAVYGHVVRPGSLPGVAFAAVLGNGTWTLLLAWPVAVGLLFPDGRPLTARWRPLVVAGGVGLAVFAFAGLLDSSAPDAPLQDLRSPLAVHGDARVAAGLLLALPAGLAMIACVVGSAVAIVLRVRRSSGVERLQAQWLAWAVSFVPGWLVVSNVYGLVAGHDAGAADPLALSAIQILVAVAIAIAILRYRLYAIERLVSRSVTYAALTALLAATFGLLVVTLGVIAGRGSPVVTAGATLGTALVFVPARRAIQDAVDRRFSRARYEAVRRVRDFDQAVRDGDAEPESIADVLRGALDEPGLEIVYRLHADEGYVDAAGEPATAPVDGTPIRRRDREIAVLGGLARARDHPDRLAAVTAAAASTIEIARLQVELRLHLAEVQESRRRIVQASYDERRRLERDLHDGAQQRLVSLGVQLRRLQRSLPGEARILAPALDDAVDDIARAITDLRTIANGLRPPRLDAGLRPALADLVRRAPVPVVIEVDEGRLPGAVEEAAYYVAAEAITNAVKHGSPSSVAVLGERENGCFRLAIRDDGVGGATPRTGSGLVGVGDRVAALGGRLAITSGRGQGTTIEVTLPCES